MFVFSHQQDSIGPSACPHGPRTPVLTQIPCQTDISHRVNRISPSYTNGCVTRSTGSRKPAVARNPVKSGRLPKENRQEMCRFSVEPEKWTRARGPKRPIRGAVRPHPRTCLGLSPTASPTLSTGCPPPAGEVTFHVASDLRGRPGRHRDESSPRSLIFRPSCCREIPSRRAARVRLCAVCSRVRTMC